MKKLQSLLKPSSLLTSSTAAPSIYCKYPSLRRFHRSVAHLKNLNQHQQPNILSDECRLLCKMVALTTKGDYHALSDEFQGLLELNDQIAANSHHHHHHYQEHSKAYHCKLLIPMAVEVVSQTHVFVGFPKVLNALAAMKKTFIGGSGKDKHHLTRNEKDWLQLCTPLDGDLLFKSVFVREDLGTEAMKQIYGEKNYVKLADKTFSLHPILHQFLLTHGYGAVLQNRFHVFLALRELCSVVSLCYSADTTAPQLVAHMKGFSRVYKVDEKDYSIHIKNRNTHTQLGISDRDLIVKGCLREAFDLSSEIYGKEIAQHMETLWDNYETSKFTL
ncbi:hypothetical protein C9374_007793 [Naegleria lovaniensis]|uniref:Uncharacterized protein n=1 Tax=Naegleria lovaniensis TaxID=51637 RepID=A0AA88GLN5_NAELO|nr:uncharacterized protein C9374_007793 [Naegleria lovaniensis]KAG2379155.1 hypothetical protein C9374_007793 [Naegleria lovaniensis]